MKGYDLVVVGVGAAGSAALYQAARRGAHVVGIDRFAPPHQMGSSHGETRITRQGVGEGLDYVPLALRAHALWREIEAETGEILLETTGALVISAAGVNAHGKPAFLESTIEAALAFDVPHEILAPAEVRARWPQLGMAEAEQAYFEPGAGLLHPERCIAAQLALARRHGAEIRLDAVAVSLEETAGGVRVTTAAGAFEAARAVVSVGAWTAGLLGGVWADRLRLYRQSLHWFAPADPAAFAPGQFPVFIWMHGSGPGDWFYGFPDLGAGVKLASEQFAVETPTPEALNRLATREEAETLFKRHAVGRIEGLTPRWLRSTACVYTLEPGSRFLVARDPARERVFVISACSGHGFKHSAAIGEAVATWALTDARPPVLAPFGL